MSQQRDNVRSRLVQAGLDELNIYGPTDFSVRRVAAKCGVSCAAPYKHFENKNAFLAAIMDYANICWTRRQKKIMRETRGSARQQILSISRDYIEFLIENPYIRSLLMAKTEDGDSETLEIKKGINNTTRKLISRYCDSVDMSEETKQVKLFIVRSMIYGAALMLDNGEIPNTPQTLDEIIKVIDREFDLP